MPVLFAVEFVLPAGLQAVEDSWLDRYAREGLLQGLAAEYIQAAPEILFTWVAINLPLLFSQAELNEPPNPLGGPDGVHRHQSADDLAKQKALEERQAFLDRLPKAIGTNHSCHLVGSSLPPRTHRAWPLHDPGFSTAGHERVRRRWFSGSPSSLGCSTRGGKAHQGRQTMVLPTNKRSENTDQPTKQIPSHRVVRAKRQRRTLTGPTARFVDPLALILVVYDQLEISSRLFLMPPCTGT